MDTETTKPKTASDTTVATDRITHEPGKSYDIIAKLELFAVIEGGERREISAAIGSPYETLGGFWRTPVRLKGLGNPTPEIYGEDSLQSLHFALEMIRDEYLKLARQVGKLVDADGREFPIEKYFGSGKS